jgi:hypothetical protein
VTQADELRVAPNADRLIDSNNVTFLGPRWSRVKATWSWVQIAPRRTTHFSKNQHVAPAT